MSVIWFVLLLLHIVLHNICLFEFQLLLTNDLELTRFCDIHDFVLLLILTRCSAIAEHLVKVFAKSRTLELGDNDLRTL